MTGRIVWLTGPPGSGKTTAGRRAAELLHRPFESAGVLFRAEAERRHLTLEAFSRYAEEHPEIDRSLDTALAASARPGTIVDGRVVGALMRRDGRPVLAVRVNAAEEVRARRVAGRDGVALAEAVREMRLRSESERARYLKWYGIDLDREAYDAVVDASALTPEAVARAVVDVVRADGPP